MGGPLNADKSWDSEALSMLTALWNHRPVISIAAIAARLGRTTDAIQTCASRFDLPAREHGDLEAADVSLARGSMRLCLICEVNAFWSSGPQNRLCLLCRRDPESGQARRGCRPPDVIVAAAEIEARPEELKPARRNAASTVKVRPVSGAERKRRTEYERWDQIFRDEIAAKKFRDLVSLYPPHGPAQPPYVDADGNPVLPELKRGRAA